MEKEFDEFIRRLKEELKAYHKGLEDTGTFDVLLWRIDNLAEEFKQKNK